MRNDHTNEITTLPSNGKKSTIEALQESEAYTWEAFRQVHAKHDPLAKETPQAYEIGLETTREHFFRAKSRPGVYHAVKDVPRSRCEPEHLQLALRSTISG